MIATIILAPLCLLVGWVSGVAWIGLPLLKMLRKETCKEPFVFGFGKDVYALKHMGEIGLEKSHAGGGDA